MTEPDATFDDIGIPFPLFEAPIREALEYLRSGDCDVCRTSSAHVFDLNMGTACYHCLRARRARFPKYTSVGSVLDADLIDALDLSPNLIREQGFENLEPHSLEPEWHTVRTAPGLLDELLVTPNFGCWSDCTWLFCCGQPMVYTGVWKADRFSDHAGSTGVELFFNSVMVDECDRITDPNPTATWASDVLDGCGGPYVFRCKSCSSYRANNDNP